MSNEKELKGKKIKGGYKYEVMGKDGKREVLTSNNPLIKETQKMVLDDTKSYEYVIKGVGGTMVAIRREKPLTKLQEERLSRGILETLEKSEGKLHKQARGYLKTTSRLVGRDTTQQSSLFDIPHFDTAINPYKETLSKMTGITGNLLLNLWQANQTDESGFYKITNLTQIAELMGQTPQELKLYLIYLGGYQYPVIKLDKDKGILSIYSDKLFYIKFNIKYKQGENANSFNDDKRIGTNYLSFIRDREVESVEVMPSPSIQEELQGKGLGNVLVDDNFVAFSLDLSDLAYKIFCFSGSNKPNFKIGFDKLISKKYLNIESQVKGTYNKAGKRIKKGAGKVRVLEKLKEAFDELLANGYFTKWSYDEKTDMFSWTYSDKIIKHKDFIKKQPEPLKIEAPQPDGTEQTGQDQTGH